MNDDVVILSTARTPFGSFQGKLAAEPAPKLGAAAIRAALERAGVSAAEVSEVLMGNVLSAGSGQAPARQASIMANIPKHTPATTVNKVCGSGMKTLLIGRSALLTQECEVVVAGGMENMTLAPYLVPAARQGLRLGDGKMIDSMVHDGLWNPYDQTHMGACAEKCAEKYQLTREAQDAYAVRSFERAIAAQKEGKFQSQIVSVEAGMGRKAVLVEEDEGPSKVKFEKIPSLKPVFKKEGSITAANASTINDGACAVVMTTASKAEKLGVKPLARIVSAGWYAHEPEWFTTAPIEAIKMALGKASWSVEETDLFEVNEAFAVVALACAQELSIPDEKINIWGGAISLGHPIGASGTRIVMNLIESLKDQGLKRGCAGICIGGGEGLAICVEVVE